MIGASGGTIEVLLVQPSDSPTVIMIRWPDAPTITATARYNEVASAAMRLLAEASTTLARIKASNRLDHPRLRPVSAASRFGPDAPAPVAWQLRKTRRCETSFSPCANAPETAYFQAAKSAG